MRHYMKPLTVGAGIIALATGCADTNTAPGGMDPVATEPELPVAKVQQSGSGVAWNGTARQLIADRLVVSPAAQLRIMTYLSVAQYNAVIAAEEARENGERASPAAAVGAASVAVLTSFFPADAASLEAALDAQLAAAVQEKNEDVAWGEEVGRAVGADVVTYAATDNTNLSIPPPIPVGPGYWTSAAAPLVLSLFGTRPFALTSPDQFRPPPRRRSVHPHSRQRWRRYATCPTTARRSSWRSRSSGRHESRPT